MLKLLLQSKKEYQNIFNENQQLKKRIEKYENYFKQQQKRQYQQQQQQLIQQQKELLKYKEKKKKQKKKQEKTMSDISQLNKIDLTKLLKNKRSYENEEENE